MRSDFDAYGLSIYNLLREESDDEDAQDFLRDIDHKIVSVARSGR